VNVGVDDLKLHETMTRNGVIIRPMTPWGYKGFIRVTTGTHYQNEKMIACLKKSLLELKS
jgi:histidinol-phosphate/aromatic aminotransferase/cobyric acid decarboxylase-like protein